VNWTANADAPAIVNRLKAARSALVLTHAKPDGDAVGSALALSRSLTAAAIPNEICFVGPIPGWLGEVARHTPRRLLAPMKPCEPADGRPWPLPTASAEPAEVIAIVDTGSWPQLAEVRPVLEGRADRAVIIDHHAHGDAEIAALRLINTRAASCTEVLAPVCCGLLDLPGAARLPLDIATPLYLGLATDTGWFRFSSVTGDTLRLAADLRDAGVVHTDLYRMIEQQDSISRWRLLGRALNSVETHELGRPWGSLSIMSLSLRDFDECHADRNDTGGFADMVLAVADVGASAILTEADVAPGEPPLTKISIRSKPIAGALDAGTLTKNLGGGGHFHAAGAKVRVGLADARRLLLEAARAL
jgi:bifunctional oligoribonuclease and PAP phosphatase NrnA